MGIHGDLNDSARIDFLSREQTTQILKYSDEDIVECTRRHTRLTEIVAALRWRVEEMPGKRPSGAKSKRQSSRIKDKRHSDQSPSKIPLIGAGKRSSLPKAKTRKWRGHDRPDFTQKDSKDHSRGGKSNLSGSVWSPPVNRDEAIQATVKFDKINRPDYL